MRNRIRNYTEILSKGPVVMGFLCYGKKNSIYLYMTNVCLLQTMELRLL